MEIKRNNNTVFIGKKVLKHSFIYFLGTTFRYGISIFMLPIYTRYLTPAEYGINELVSMTIEVISIFIGAGLLLCVARFYYDTNNQNERNEIISSLLILILSIYGASLFILVPFSEQLSLLIFKTEKYKSYFYLMFITLFFQSGLTIALTFIRVRQNSILYVCLNLGYFISQVSLNIYYVAYRKLGVLGIIYSTLISSLIFGIGLIIWMFKNVGFHFSFIKAKQFFRYGFPMVGTNIGAFIITFSDHYFINTFATLKEVGIYSLAYKFGFVLSAFVAGPFFAIWGPLRFEIASSRNANRLYYQYFTYFCILLITAGLFISLFAKDLLRIICDPRYFDAYRFIPLIILAYIFQGLTYFVNLGILLKKRTEYTTISSWIAVLVCLGLNFLLIPRFGAYGAAIATFITFAIRLLLTWIFAERLHPIGYPWNKSLKLIAIATTIYLLSIFNNKPQNVITSIVFHFCLFISFLLILYLTNIFTREEKETIRQFFNNPIKMLANIVSKGY